MNSRLCWRYSVSFVQRSGDHLETLDDRRIDGGGGNGNDDPRPDRHRGQGPTLTEDVDDEEHRRHQGDQDQQPVGGEPGCDVGESRTEEAAPVGQHQLEHVESIDHRSDQGDQGEHHREMGLGPAGDSESPARESDATVEVVGDHDHQGGQHEGVEEPVGHRPTTRAGGRHRTRRPCRKSDR